MIMMNDERRSSSLELPTSSSVAITHHGDVGNTTNIIQAKYNEFLSPSMRSLAALLICATAIIGGANYLSSWDTHNSSDAATTAAAASSIENRVTTDNNEHHNFIQSDSNSIQKQRSIIQKTNARSRDLFLLSGQSNMVGHTTSGHSIGGNSTYWDGIKSILENNKNNKFEELYNIIYETNYQNKEVAQSLTSGVIDLYQSSLLNDLDTPMQYGKCSFQYVENDTTTLDASSGTVPISLDANCGSKFGHELTFGRTLELEFEYMKEFELIKVARGGSGLYEHWYPNHGLHWHLLKETIEERSDDASNWKGLVWHQGSQAAWSMDQYSEDRSLTYLGNLTGLVNEVRTLMFDTSKMWQCKEEIPVVIVQVGFWPENDAGQRVRDAQAKFCDEDPRAVLVKTDDLSRFYHYDAVSFLITGRRIAYAYKEALESVGVCPGGASFRVFSIAKDRKRSAWIVHGVIGTIVFGILVPISSFTPFFHGLIPVEAYTVIHIATYVMTFVTVSVALKTMGGLINVGESHSKENHHIVGLLLLLLVSIQTLGSISRKSRLVTVSGLLAFAFGVYEVHSGLGLFALQYDTIDLKSVYLGYIGWLMLVVIGAKLWMRKTRVEYTRIQI